MENKYLPLGSICTLKGKNKKIMIIGYYSVEYNGNIKIKDYIGCVYPEGMLLPEQVCNFNHEDIEAVNFVGYKNEELKIFMNNFDKLTGNNTSLEQDAINFHEKNDMVLTSSNTYSKILFDENGVVMIAEPLLEEKNAETNNYEFDKNGVVIGDNSKPQNPFYKEYSSQENETSDFNSLNIFDKPNTLEVSDFDFEAQKKSLINKIEFDENGIVVAVQDENDESDSTIELEFPESDELKKDDKENNLPIDVELEFDSETKKGQKYNFDENGILISVE